ncbi:ankyrin repeat domain-containing protein [Streptomyces sp. NPDC003273]|uniref:ankyrin repeat domain-containing protein n=1 Tax=Streptomyces sp. NPDC003273 TaxID=3364678 RepID=UPI0036B240C8
MRAAAPGAADADGWTPLHFAAQAQAPAVVEVLLAEGAAVDVVDRHGDTPLSRAVFCSRGEGGTIRLLLCTARFAAAFLARKGRRPPAEGRRPYWIRSSKIWPHPYQDDHEGLPTSTNRPWA